MNDPILPPKNCQWWSPGDPTRNPPEDKEFLQLLTDGGFKTFIADGGLCGGTVGCRTVDVIHRGFGRRWEMGFIQAEVETYSAIVTLLPLRVEAATAWLTNESIERVKEILHRQSNEND